VRVFVYGTLRPSLYPGRAGALRRARALGPATLRIHGQLVTLGAFPAIVTPTDATQTIVGELIEADAAALADARSRTKACGQAAAASTSASSSR
jgi:gamma-glutamylcyclotransferase (GGCT)/AIG2-like uncharacterized protein YtfP